MFEKFEKLGDILKIPVAVISLLSGSIAIAKSAPWYVSSPLLVMGCVLIIYYVFKKNPHNNFKVIRQEIIVDILDKTGRNALYKNISQLKAVKKNAQGFQYRVFSDGSIYDIKVESGTIDSVGKDSNKTLIQTSLPAPLEVGAEFVHTLSCTLKDTFLSEKEYWESTRFTPGTKVNIKIFFPNDRVCKEYRAYQKHGAKKVKCDKQPSVVVIDGKVCLHFLIEQVKLMETYRVEWSW